MNYIVGFCLRGLMILIADALGQVLTAGCGERCSLDDKRPLDPLPRVNL